MAENKDAGGLPSQIPALLTLYVIYVFLSGWAFLDYYFRFFGIDPKTLDISLYDTLAKGFTILFTGGKWLWIIYVALVFLPLLFGTILKTRELLRAFVLSGILIGLLVLVYFVSRAAGEAQAKIDKGKETTLPDITFKTKTGDFHGKLVFLKSDRYFVHGVGKIGGNAPSELELSVYRSEEVSEVKIAEHE